MKNLTRDVKQSLISELRRRAMCDEATAIAYLEAEEWDADEAVISCRADRRYASAAASLSI
jgi:hypothetical protein